MKWCYNLCGIIDADPLPGQVEEEKPIIEGIFGLISRLPPRLRIDEDKQEIIDSETKIYIQPVGKIYNEYLVQAKEERLNLMIKKEVYFNLGDPRGRV